MRPTRKRKLTNYGEGHLHWIEESQLQKALIKSLREKTIKAQSEKETDYVDASSTSKMPRLSVSLGHDKIDPDDDLKKVLSKPAKSNKVKKVAFSDAKKPTRQLRSKGKPANSLTEASTSHATMMQPRNCETSGKDSKPPKVSKNDDEDKVIPENSSSVQNHKTRAQRKFASNSSPPTMRNSTRVEGKRKKGTSRLYEEEKCSPISDEPLPETKNFINYLCFRNTPFNFDLEDND